MCEETEYFGEDLDYLDYRPMRDFGNGDIRAPVEGEWYPDVTLFHYSRARHDFIRERSWWTTLWSNDPNVIGRWIGYEVEFSHRAVWTFTNGMWRSLIIQGNIRRWEDFQIREFMNRQAVQKPNLIWEEIGE